MLIQHPELSLGDICGLFGYTRQAYYKRKARSEEVHFQSAVVLDLVKEIREKIPRLGGRKLYFLLKDKFVEHGFKIGRDCFFDILRVNDLLIKPRKRRLVTTQSKHFLRKYPNLITELVIDQPNRLWVSDITYIRVGSSWNYVIFITDAYSRKVVGYHVDNRMDTAFCLKALEQALVQWRDRSQVLIHHSDRGLQYCSYAYTGKLLENEIQISMTQNGDPYENAMAERVNGIFKTDFEMNKSFRTLKQARLEIEQMVYHYNHTRPHASCDYLTPVQAHQMSGLLPRRW